MLCSSCRRSLLTRLNPNNPLTTTTTTTSLLFTRSIATTPQTPHAAPSTPPSSTQPSLPASTPATSSSTPGHSQPFSSPFFPAQKSADTFLPSAASPRKLPSTLAGGTPMPNLVYLKNPPKPLVALEDDEYPPWLWRLLDPPADAAQTVQLPGALQQEDLARMSKKVRGKYERKMARLMEGMEKPTPLHEQSRDLTREGEDAFASLARRSEVTKSARSARRKGVREANFLRSM